MRLSVCPHDIVKQMQTWLDFATYLQRRLDTPISLEPVTDFDSFYKESLPYAHLAFVNPMDAWVLVQQHHFLPLFRTELYDEVVFITRKENREATLEDFAGQVIAAVDRQFATYLGLYILQERGLTVAGVALQPSWTQVIRVLMRGEFTYGLLYRDFYTGLSDLAREQFHVVWESQTGYATHMMLLHPEYGHWQDRIEQVLATMHEDPEGAAILNTLRLGRWVSNPDLGTIERIVTLRVNPVTS